MKTIELKDRVIQGLTNKKYTPFLAKNFHRKEEFLKLADLYEQGRVDVYTKDEYQLKMKRLIEDFEAEGNAELLEEAKADLRQAERREIIIIARSPKLLA